jgi:hypothetical protein
MAIHVRHPMWLEALSRPGIGAFTLLFTIESFARATLATVIPLQAYAPLQAHAAIA